MHADQIQIEILADGRLKVTTDEISTPNHRNADALLTLMAQLLGGETVVQPNAQTHSHVHRQQQAGH